MPSTFARAASLVVSIAALIVAVLAVTRTPAPTAVSAAADDGRERELRQLGQQVAELRAQIEGLTRAPAEASTEASNRRPALDSPASDSSDEQAIAGLQKRVTDLETSIAALRQPPRRGGEPPRVADLDAAQRTVMDPRASDAAKIAALKALRGQQIGGQDARSHEVVLALIELVNRSDDPNARTDVYRNLHGVDDPTLRESMLRSLSSDPSPMVREQAAKDIDTFLADPSVAAALRSAAESDPDLKVRTHAAETLGNKH